MNTEWLAWRRQGIGGSDLGALLGVSQFRTPFDLWVDKTHGSRQIDTPDTRRGIHLEDGIARWYGQERNAEIQPASPIFRVDAPFARCTPDRIAYADGRRWLVSIKAPRRSTGWGAPGTEDIPLSYYLQCQWEMLVAESAEPGVDSNRCELAALLYGELAIYPIAANREVQQAALERARAFWMEHVLANVPPPLDSGETAGPWLSRKYSATPLREFVESTPVIDVLALEWMLAEAKIKELETGIESVKNKLRDAIGSEDAAGVDGPFGRISWRQDKNGKRSLRPKWK